MDDINEYETSAFNAPDDGTLYVDCIRLVEGGHVRRFEITASRFDVVAHELNGEITKPLLFYAIEHNDETFVQVLLNMEVPLDKAYSVMVPSAASSESQLIQKVFNAYEYALELQHYNLAALIEQHTNLPPYEQRLCSTLKLNDTRRCDAFIHALNSEKRENAVAIQGFFYAARLGSVRLLDHFLTRWKLDVNTQQQEDGFSTTALLTSIKYNRNEAAKFLLFRNADSSIKGQYDNALVTALHYNSESDLLRMLLDKNVDLTARHPDYTKYNLREYCVLTNRVKPKTEIDAYIIRLINQGNYDRLKWLVEHGYMCINVAVNSKRDGRQLAKERYYDKIVKLIDAVENAQMRAKIKMNY